MQKYFNTNTVSAEPMDELEAYEKGFITEDQGNSMWKEMLQKGRKIGAKSFSEYLKKQRDKTPV